MLEAPFPPLSSPLSPPLRLDARGAGPRRLCSFLADFPPRTESRQFKVWATVHAVGFWIRVRFGEHPALLLRPKFACVPHVLDVWCAALVESSYSDARYFRALTRVS